MAPEYRKFPYLTIYVYKHIVINIMRALIDASLRHPRAVFAIVAAAVALAGLQLPRITIDTDPENMLPASQPDRLFHDRAREDFALHDMIVVGIVDDEAPEGVFRPEALARIHELTDRIQAIDGVLPADLLAPSTVDNILREGPGTIRFEWLMDEPPLDAAGAERIRDHARRLPMLDGTVVSEDGRAVALYVPIESKTESHRIATEIEAIVAELPGDEEVHVTGLPVAEDTFGVEMFRQMAISAPLAALVVLALLALFFRSPVLVLSPMILALATVTIVMGTLIGAGFTVHIMSSMIPIFLMPIAVVDSVHILSEFADAHRPGDDPRTTVRSVLDHLFTPMLYTSLTSAAGFASLALTPIPPVRVFGLFVAFGILLAFVGTVTFLPAYVVSLGPARLASMRRDPGRAIDDPLSRAVRALGRWTGRRARVVLALTLAATGLSAYGISRIQINDNPVRWFQADHPIRVADRILNEHFAGTYMAYLVLEHEDDGSVRSALDRRVEEILADGGEGRAGVREAWRTLAASAPDLQTLASALEDRLMASGPDEELLWEDLLVAVEEAQSAERIFQQPEALAFVEDVQRALADSGRVGKSSSVADVVKTVHRELRGGDEEFFTIPGTAPAVAQTLLTYQSSHRPNDLWHMVTPDLRAANVWVQLTSGDNQDMARVVEHLDLHLATNPPPDGISVRWSGLTYINVVWQDAMVRGMLESLAGSFVVVLLMMIALFRSVRFGLLSMLPLSLTIALIYGLIGLAGKAYDMPVAVLSALTLGLSIDFAIHFLQRARSLHDPERGWPATLPLLFEEPGRAIARNAVVIAIGFLPLLLAPLVPYQTVGLFMAGIMAISSLVTLALLPSILGSARGRFLPEASATRPTAPEVPS